MDKHQQVFWTDINLRHKNKCPKKNNQHKRNYLLTSKQQNTVSNIVPILYGEQQKKMVKKNLKLVLHLSVSPTTIHVVKLIPCLSSKKTMINKRKMATVMPFRRQTIQTWRNTRHTICPHTTKTKSF